MLFMLVYILSEHTRQAGPCKWRMNGPYTPKFPTPVKRQTKHQRTMEGKVHPQSAEKFTVLIALGESYSSKEGVQ